MKNTLNQYEDKRTIALVFVRQNIWVRSMLKLKKDNDVNVLPEAIRNTLKYIEQPNQTISIFANQRKEQIYRSIFKSEEGDLTWITCNCAFL